MGTARRFAAALGIIVFVFVLGFGIYNGTELETVLVRGLLALVIFSVIGFACGLIGATIAQDSAANEKMRKDVAEKVKKKLAAEQKQAPEDKKPAEAGRRGSRIPA